MLVQWTSKLCPYHIQNMFGVQIHFIIIHMRHFSGKIKMRILLALLSLV